MLTYIFNKNSKVSLYEQLYQFIKDDIIEGIIEGGQKLPSKREFAAHLGVSKVTVENAYNSLVSEGYVYSLEKKGYYAERGLSIPRVKSAALKQEDKTEKPYDIDLSSNTVPTSKFPFSAWSKLMREQILNYSTELLDPLPYNGAASLRKAISNYLFQERGMNVSPSSIIIGAGSEYLYSLIIRLLGNDKIYGIETPSYHKIQKVYKMNSAVCRPIKLTNDGIDKSLLYESGADVIHISPSHNFPTGYVMNVRNRHEVISWANSTDGRYIIEDDFDSELRFSGKPLQPLQTLDTMGKVIYINTFSKTISPSFRIGYMVLPESLSEKYKNELGFNSCTVPSFEQYTLAEFIEKGYYERHINRMKKYYRVLRNDLLEAFNISGVSNKASIIEAGAGLHFSLKLDTDIPDKFIKEKMEERGVKVSFLSDYDGEEHILIVNYSGLNSEKFASFLLYLNDIICHNIDYVD